MSDSLFIFVIRFVEMNVSYKTGRILDCLKIMYRNKINDICISTLSNTVTLESNKLILLLYSLPIVFSLCLSLFFSSPQTLHPLESLRIIIL